MINTSAIFAVAEKLTSMARTYDAKPLDKLKESAESVGKSWSGSWLGYHSRVYYKDFVPTPPGARFSKEWGMMQTYSFQDTVGEWEEYQFDGVVAMIHELAGDPSLKKTEQKAKAAKDLLEESKASLLSLLTPALEEFPADALLQDLVEKIRKQTAITTSGFIQYLSPKGQQMSRDMNAIQAGFQTPPHIAVLANTVALRSAFTTCDDLAKLAVRAASHIQNRSNRQSRQQRIGTNVFIGHGRSTLWKDLRDFVEKRLRLPWDEFNRVPVAGISNVDRLSRMLDESAIAFLVLTGDDERAGGGAIARLNVVHEVGLFQGRLGFERAIVLLEEGCEEFSNINGLGQIRFPKGNISAIFEEVRKVLEREQLITMEE